MKWFGILALVFIFFVLGGIIYVGANTDKLGYFDSIQPIIEKKRPDS